MEMETSTPGHHEGSREANPMAPDSDLGDDSPMSHNGDDDLSDGLDEGGGGGQSPPSGGDSPRHHHHPHAAALLAAAAAATAAGGGVAGDHTDVLAKLKMQVRDIKNDYDRPLPFQLGGVGGLGGTPHLPSQPRPTNGAPPTSTTANGGGLQHVPQDSFQLPVPFPFPHPAAAFLPPVSTAHQPPQTTAPSSGSSHSSEGSNASSQHTWSFEEQFKQVRQLYEINDDPKRKEFLDDLFSFMQKRGTPINRLPIMAKSVLDLYELYNLVIARGGLVDVINKKLWQEIIKGLHLPSSITSAAFTLRTQYMKYLYPYECEKRRLSTPAELQAAIDGNRREGRRSSYGQYDQMQRSPNPAAGLQMSPLSLVQQQHTQQQLAARMLSLHHQQQQQHNGAHHPSHPPPMGQPTANGVQGGPLPGLAPSEFEARMMEYVKLLNKEMRTTAADFAGGGCGTPPPVIRAGGDISPPTIPSSTSPLHPLEMSRMTLWNLYSNNNHPVQPTANANAVEPQKEPINLSETSNTIKREPECRESPPAAKRVSKEEDMDDREDEDDEDDEQEHEQERLQEQQQKSQQLSPSAHIKINSRGDLRNGDNSLVVSMELNGVTYQGVLFAQNPPSRTAMAS